MKAPLLVRPFTPDQSRMIRAGLRFPSAFTLRRCQILLARAEGLKPSAIRARLGFSTQTVGNALRAFEAEGVACMQEKSHRPASARPEIDDGGSERIHALPHRSPRDFGKVRGWQGWAARRGSEGFQGDRLVGEQFRSDAGNSGEDQLGGYGGSL
ncbi:helix-turn-helix domain-containing protein [Tautonia rosea]|uniref:helix-turn-helix domain-containing protein n=1 Tax=Tautonia rosea TaxID=2728037 RepID=UPI001473FB77|nr:helix-turn-helix domain-containing protein [Tautonia rosea]